MKNNALFRDRLLTAPIAQVGAAYFCPQCGQNSTTDHIVLDKGDAPIGATDLGDMLRTVKAGVIEHRYGGSRLIGRGLRRSNSPRRFVPVKTYSFSLRMFWSML